MGEVIYFTMIEDVAEFQEPANRWLDDHEFNDNEKVIFSYGPADYVYFTEDPDTIGMEDIYKPIGEIFQEGDDVQDLHKSRPIHELLSSMEDGEQFILGGRTFEFMGMDLDEYRDEEDE